MWKLLIVALLSIAAHAEQKGIVDRMEAESQDAEECATAPASAHCGESTDQCLGEESIKKFEKASANSMRVVKEQAEFGSTMGKSLKNVWTGLVYSRLVKEAYPFERNVTEMDASKLLTGEGFVNLAKCKELENKIKDTKNIPLGAVLTFVSKDHKRAIVRIKTPSGCIGAAEQLSSSELANINKSSPTQSPEKTIELLKDLAAREHVRKGECSNISGFDLTGVYVKNVN